MFAEATGQVRGVEIPGAVQLENGLILRGMCDAANTVDDQNSESRKLELRKIDQDFRTYFVSNRRAEAAKPDELAVPRQDFTLIQRRQSQRPLNYQIGVHQRKDFGPDGKSVVTLYSGLNETLDIDVGITAVNAQRVSVDGLSHRWDFGISTTAIPETTLYSGRDMPSLLLNVRGFANDGQMQLNAAQMLLEAEKYDAARKLISDIESDFPDLEGRCARLSDAWNDQMARRFLEELTQMRNTGKYRTAQAYVRLWPEQNLAPFVRVKARDFVSKLEEQDHRLALIRQTLSMLVGAVADETTRRKAMRLWTAFDRELDKNSLPGLELFEFSQGDDNLSPEAKLSLAISGVYLGADAAFDTFPEAEGLYELRLLLQDYLRTTADEQTIRNDQLQKMRIQEGYSIDRVAALLKHLPPQFPVRIDDVPLGQAGTFAITAEGDSCACVGQVPAEYAVNRRYPLIIAFPRGGLTGQQTIDWWGKSANRDGYIVVVPELYAEDEGTYAASADQHRRFIGLVQRLKAGLSIDDDRVFVAGHGIGGEAAMDIGTAHPDLFAGVVSLASLGRRHLSWTAHNSTALPWYIVAGSRQPRWSARLRPLVEKLFRMPGGDRREFSDVLFVRYDERGFESFAEERVNLFRWLNFQRRKQLPEVIDATVLRSTDTNWFWLKLNSVPMSNISLDEPSTWNDRPRRNGTVSAKISGNLVRLSSLPDDATLYLSPELPGLDVRQSVTVVSVRGKSQKITYTPRLRDMLEHFREWRDRERLCYMTVPVSR